MLRPCCQPLKLPTGRCFVMFMTPGTAPVMMKAAIANSSFRTRTVISCALPKISDGGPVRSQRQLRVGEEIRHALASILMRGDVPWPPDFTPPNVTVTEVQVSPDLKNATAFVMPLGGVRLDETVRILNNH